LFLSLQLLLFISDLEKEGFQKKISRLNSFGFSAEFLRWKTSFRPEQLDEVGIGFKATIPSNQGVEHYLGKLSFQHILLQEFRRLQAPHPTFASPFPF